MSAKINNLVVLVHHSSSMTAEEQDSIKGHRLKHDYISPADESYT